MIIWTQSATNLNTTINLRNIKKLRWNCWNESCVILLYEGARISDSWPEIETVLHFWPNVQTVKENSIQLEYLLIQSNAFNAFGSSKIRSLKGIHNKVFSNDCSFNISYLVQKLKEQKYIKKGMVSKNAADLTRLMFYARVNTVCYL